MRGYELLEKMELIHADYVMAANEEPIKKKGGAKKWWLTAACLCLIFCLTVPVMAASIPAFYEMLYAISPATAQYFKPVQMSCEDNGIRMEVVAVYVHEDTAQIYITMQDIEGTRLDETADLFDSYQIHTPFDGTGTCRLTSYDPDTKTATFLITIERWNEQAITGGKITFSVEKFISHKKMYKDVLEEVALDRVELETLTQKVMPRGFSEADDDGQEGQVTVLKPSGAICVPTEGVTLTSIGYIDGRLRVQVYYEDILNTDNHGMISLINRNTGEKINCDFSVSFFDEAEKGSYEEYIFTGVPEESLTIYDLYGDFVTSSGCVEGNWSVTFPLENTGNPSS
ncbi:MAG TPA: DUF4179 domain-containing protein [Firmicutes bacterium]|nr:DUF4179 domain-containing protein [Bacillota bacterium]